MRIKIHSSAMPEFLTAIVNRKLGYLFLSCLLLSLASGCASYGVIKNPPKTEATTDANYSLKAFKERSNETGKSLDFSILLAFSGGGTRSAAFSYGVLDALRETTIEVEGQSRRLLDHVTVISSVSGGSFTSAYYGLHGDKIFEDFDRKFLKQDVNNALLRGLFNPLLWFSSTGRTEMAVQFYENQVFQNATFADMNRKDAPLILINASDLGAGVRFSFIQEYFDLLCSDLSQYPVARAVTASSAVPVLFNPVVLENYKDCDEKLPPWVVAAQNLKNTDPEVEQAVEGLESYGNDKNRQYIHFVDGGITDNLGLRAIYEIIEISGGAKPFMAKLGSKPPKNIAIISVNAATTPVQDMDQTTKQPSIEDTVGAMSDIQLKRYNTTTIKLMNESITRWADEISTPDQKVNPHFIQVSFEDISKSNKLLKFFNAIPTSFSLSEEQVDNLKEAGRRLLKADKGFQKFLKAIQSPENDKPIDKLGKPEDFVSSLSGLESKLRAL